MEEGSKKQLCLRSCLCGFVHEEAVSCHSPWWQTCEFIPVCLWCPSNCCPGVGAQRESVCISPNSISGPLRGDTWESWSFIFHPNLHWFLQTVVMRTYLPGTGTLGWVVWYGPGIPHSLVSFPSFIHHTSPHLCISISPTHLNECEFFNSLVVGLP